MSSTSVTDKGNAKGLTVPNVISVLQRSRALRVSLSVAAVTVYGVAELLASNVNTVGTALTTLFVLVTFTVTVSV